MQNRAVSIGITIAIVIGLNVLSYVFGWHYYFY